jgi:hypothetical protein
MSKTLRGPSFAGLRPLSWLSRQPTTSEVVCSEQENAYHGDSRSGVPRASHCATAVPSLRPDLGSFGLRPLYCPWSRCFSLHYCNAAYALRPLCVARDLGWCNHEYPRWGGHITIPKSIATTSVLGASASIMGSELSVQLGSGPSVCPTPMP